jgi:preprotein translocase subunit SecD
MPRTILAIVLLSSSALVYAEQSRTVFLYRACSTDATLSSAQVIRMPFLEGANIHSEPEPVCLEQKRLSAGKLIKTASVISGQPDETYALRLVLTDLGTEEMKRVSAANLFQRIAVTVDGRIVLFATFVNPLQGREIVIRGIGSVAFRVARVFNDEK